ncbi:MAG: CSLREA domain-containing protein [Gammaproteobacteria bacterium]
MFQRKSQGIGAGLGFFRPIRYPLFLITLASGLFAAPSLQAATFPVTSTADAVDATPGDGTCATSAGVCSLRAAIQEANALAGADTINLPAGTYTLTLAGKNENAAASGDLDVTGTDDLTILGAGAAVTRIAQQGTGIVSTALRGTVDRVFHLIGRNNVTIDGVAIEKGYAYVSSGGGSLGGGIYNAGAFVTLKNCEISQNIAEWANGNVPDSQGTGGGIYNASGTRMTIENCTIGNNIVEIPVDSFGNNFRDGGGGIYNVGEMTIRNSIVENNSTIRYGSGILNSGALTIVASILRGNSDATPFTQGQSSSRGGAIANIGGRLTLRDSSVTGNLATQGAGIYNDAIATEGVVIIVSSDISRNTAQLWGGGIDNFSTMSILYSSITNNIVGSGSFILIGDGGGIHNSGFSTLTVKHSTLSGNRAFRAGGGLFNGSRAELAHVTLSNNRAGAGVTASADGLKYALGNEVFIDPDVSSNDATVFQSSIIAGLVSPAAAVGNCFSGSFVDDITNATQFTAPKPFTTTSKGYNIDNGSTCKLVAANDLPPNANALLGVLTDVGSTAGGGPITLPGGITLPRWVHVPAVGPAVDAIPTGACPTPGVDQRLHVRPYTTSGCDIGAVEINSTPAAITDLQIILTTSAATGRALKAASSADPVNYTITVTNNGPGDASGVRITQTLDAGVVMATSNSPQGATCQQSGSAVTCTYDKVLKKGDVIVVYVVVTPPRGAASLKSTATVSSASTAVVDFVPDNNSAALTVSAALEPIPNSSTPGAAAGGGGGAFGMIPLAVLGMFGVWLGYRRRVSCKA